MKKALEDLAVWLQALEAQKVEACGKVCLGASGDGGGATGAFADLSRLEMDGCRSWFGLSELKVEPGFASIRRGWLPDSCAWCGSLAVKGSMVEPVRALSLGPFLQATGSFRQGAPRFREAWLQKALHLSLAVSLRVLDNTC